MERPYPRVTVIAVGWENPAGWQVLVNSFRAQTSPLWKLHLVHDGPPSDEVRGIFEHYASKDGRIQVGGSVERLGSWGHPLRRMALDKFDLSTEYVVVTNNDNYYVPFFVGDMLDAAEAAGNPTLVHCDMIHDRAFARSERYLPFPTELAYGEVDIGAVMVRTEVARKVGWRSMARNSDWTYISDVMGTPGFRVAKVGRILFVHN